MNVAIDDVKFDDSGLVPAVVQDARTGEVLTLAYMNAESLHRTIREGQTWFWSRSRAALWHKGATSGNTQRVVGVRLDCDRDAIVVQVEPAGPACHTGARTCFHNSLEGGPEPPTGQRDLGEVIDELYTLVESRRREAPEGSYTAYLFAQGLDKILKKVGEEAAETIIAAKNADTRSLVGETSDLLYHLIVLLVERGVALDDVRDELARRGGKQSAS
jgi:phosphoribosyl-ATP pyrophosphohydrolase/phosphoribosyl-AMP cyclohydrolase